MRREIRHNRRLIQLQCPQIMFARLFRRRPARVKFRDSIRRRKTRQREILECAGWHGGDLLPMRHCLRSQLQPFAIRPVRRAPLILKRKHILRQPIKLLVRRRPRHPARHQRQYAFLKINSGFVHVASHS